MTSQLPKAPTFASRLRSGQPLVGCQVGGESGWLIEMSALAGYDYVTVDVEHEAVAEGELLGLVRAADSVGIPVMVRTHCDKSTQRLLNTGVDGIQVPDVVSLEDIADVVHTTRFHPLGQRGYQKGTRSAGYGLAVDEKEFRRQANQSLVVVAMIEDISTLDHLDDYLATEGVDAFYVGPGDLAQSMGFPDQQQVSAVVDEIVARAVAAGRTIGLGVYEGFAAADLAQRRAEGVSFFSVILGRFIARRVTDVRQQVDDAVRPR